MSDETVGWYTLFWIAMCFVSLVGGCQINTKYSWLQKRITWAETMCKDHGGILDIDTSVFNGAEVDCMDKTHITGYHDY